MKSFAALEHFVEYWRHRPGFLVDAGGNSTFRALVRCEPSNAASAACFAVVRIRMQGSDNGTIRLEDNARLPLALSLFDGFSARRQEYEFDDADGTLRVSAQIEREAIDCCIAIMPA